LKYVSSLSTRRDRNFSRRAGAKRCCNRSSTDIVLIAAAAFCSPALAGSGSALAHAPAHFPEIGFEP
jgi:hypothetical protein